MGLFDRFFKKEDAYINAQNYFKLLTPYAPVWTSWSGCIYESELVRSAIDARARHISKLKVEIHGAAKPKLQARLRLQPNTLQTWSQFLYRTSTILDVCNTCLLIPTLGEYGETTGFLPVLPTRCELINYEDELWLRYQFSNGQMGAMEWNRCIVLTKHQYKNDFFGDSNSALNETMKLIHIQNQGVEEAVKNSSNFRFIAQMSNFSKAEDLKNERMRFVEQNLKSGDDNGGLLLFPNTYKDIRQVTSQAYTVDPKQLELIKTNVQDYFGVSEDVLQNKAYGDAWSAFYEGAVEPFAIQFSEAMTKAMFTERERAQGSYLMATSNRLQYLSNQDKLNVSAQMADRGIMTRNEIREIWNLPPIEGGDLATIRGEYYFVDEKQEEQNGDQE
jgi:hypothetical protein